MWWAGRDGSRPAAARNLLRGALRPSAKEAPVSSDDHLDPDFIERQRQRLEALREQIIETSDDASQESRQLLDDQRDVPGDHADDATNLNLQEIDASLQVQEQQRLAEVQRALEKIAEGTYGRSDVSGDPIPRARLEARPEARHTIEEEEVLEMQQRAWR
jgi:DnaK suppressor protein